jgi:chemotaxis protein methyltransferase CheR
MSSAIARVAALVRRETGIELGPPQFASLEASVARLGDGMTAERLLAASSSGAVVEQLINEVTVRETFFFRHRRELETIDWRRSLEAARGRGSEVVRVWVAGCASGEEAYSIAILACEAFASSAPPVRVIATDIATAALEQARHGRYSARSTAAVGDDLRRRYFTIENGRMCVGGRLRELIEFRRQNLVRDLAPSGAHGGFDVISCRNVLIYFDPPTVERVMCSIESALAPLGTLVLGAADSLSGRPASGIRPVRSQRPTARRGNDRPRPRARPAPTGGPAPPRSLSEALAAADRGDLGVALEITSETLARDPLDTDAYYVRGLAELARHDERAAIASLRRAVYIDGDFSPALFKLACAHDAVGSVAAARQAYERTLRSLGRYAQAPRELVQTVDLADIAVACHARLGVIAGARRAASEQAA